MRTRETRQYEVLVRVQDFGKAHSEAFPESSTGGQAFAAVAQAVAELSRHDASKASRSRGRSSPTARAALIAQLDVIENTARAIAEDHPSFDDPFLRPREQSEQALLRTGRVYIDDVQPGKDQFIAHGLPPTFVADLTALVDRFDQAIRTRETERSASANAQANITAGLESGLSWVRKLDAIVANQFHADPGTMAAWETARRIKYPRRPSRLTTAPAPQGTAETPAAPASASAVSPAPAAETAPIAGAPAPITTSPAAVGIQPQAESTPSPEVESAEGGARS